MSNPIVLFLCTGNSCRSQMAEAILRARAGDRYDSRSAGTEPKSEIHPLAIRVMAERGIDLAGQRPKGVAAFLGRAPVRHLIIVCGGANDSCPTTFPGVVTREFWPLEDPASAAGPLEEQLVIFREARDEIERRIMDWLHKQSEPAR
ncbi:MAG: arsenate reductase ArsC [Planctomycetes bacterium]|nr:arsenate reductase ArsC [Planctomycetota bacterium]